MKAATPVIDTENDVETDTKVKGRRPWIIILFNDDKTPMEFVTFLLIEVFGKNENDAYDIMMTIHKKGSAIVWSGGKELGEHRYYQIKELCNKYKMDELKYDLQEG